MWLLLSLDFFAIPIIGPPASANSSGAGVSYIHWGRTTCNETVGTSLLYTGVTAAGSFRDRGGGSHYICLPNIPEYLDGIAGAQIDRSYVTGTGYDFPASSAPSSFSGLAHFPVACSACYTAERDTQIMIPGRYECPPSWTREYYGYLMAGHDGHRRLSYECVDADPEAVPNGQRAENARFYFTEARCNGISCPPYAEGYELTCAVCTN